MEWLQSKKARTGGETEIKTQTEWCIIVPYGGQKQMMRTSVELDF